MQRKKIAVLLASIDREYQQNFASGLASAGSEYGIDVCIFNSQGHSNIEVDTSDVGESMIYDLPDLNGFDGLISLPATASSDLMQQKMFDVLARLRGKPHVSIDVPQEGAVTITFNDRDSIEELTEHLISVHGVRTVAFVSGPLEAPVAFERVLACRDVMRRHGLDLDDSMILDGQWTRIGGRACAEKLLGRGGKLPDAIMCGNDDMALSVIECLKDHGIRVPEDVIVTGFDALQEAVLRGLTTIHRPIDRCARKAIEVLSAWIDGREPQEKTVFLSTRPVFGLSCGCSQDLESVNEKLCDLISDKWGTEAALIRITLFSGAMAGVNDEAEARDKIRSLVRALDIREFYLCSNPAISREGTYPDADASYPDKMLLLYGIRDGQPFEPSVFPTRDLTPALTDPRETTACLVFCPLYYRDHIMGYTAISLGDGTGSALYPLLMLLNGALISLYMQTNNKRSASIIRRMSVRDIMTGMLNRRGFMEQAPLLLQQARKERKCFALLWADMNRMKFINDQYGHLAGDEAICRMGRALRSLSERGMTPVHISGDEFLAYGIIGSPDSAGDLVRYAKEQLERLNREDPWICYLTAGVGIYAAVPQEEDTIDTFMTRADQAMYEDKNKRKYGRRKDDIVAGPPSDLSGI